MLVTRFAALLLLSAFVLMPRTAEACSLESHYEIYPSHILIEGQCSSAEEADQVCEAIAVEHGYTGGWCWASTGTQVTGGWFREQQYGAKVPFRYVRLTYAGPYVRPNTNLGVPKCKDQCFGDPVNAGTGNKFETHVEYRGAGAFPLELSWTYNSQFVQSYTQSFGLNLGRKRTHFYGRTVQRVDSSAWVTRPDGNVLRFESTSQGWVAEAGRAELLQQLPNGWLLDTGHGETEVFGSDGRLLELHKGSSVHLLTYSTSGLLQMVADEQGRRLQFEYNTSNLISRVVLPDGSPILFRYSAYSDLTEIEYSDGSKRQYLYNELAYADNSAPAGALTGVLDENSARFSTTRFDRYNRALSTEMGGGIADVSSSAYTLAASGNYSSSAIIRPANGASRSVTFGVVNGGVFALSSVTTCAGCAGKQVQYSYDSNGSADLVTVNGVTNDYDYDSQGHLVRVVESSNSSATRRTIETDWHPVLDLPIERRTYNAAGVLVQKEVWTYNSRGQVLTHLMSDL